MDLEFLLCVYFLVLCNDIEFLSLGGKEKILKIKID